MALPTLTFYDPATQPGFSLHDATGALLIRFPPSITLPSGLGVADPYTWDRPPGSGAWFALGDGLPRIRPTMTLSGPAVFNNRDESLAFLSLLKSVLPRAARLFWVGQAFQDLEPFYPGSDLSELAQRARVVNVQVILNIRGTATTGQPGQPVPGSTPPPPDTGHY